MIKYIYLEENSNPAAKPRGPPWKKIFFPLRGKKFYPMFCRRQNIEENFPQGKFSIFFDMENLK